MISRQAKELDSGSEAGTSGATTIAEISVAYRTRRLPLTERPLSGASLHGCRPTTPLGDHLATRSARGGDDGGSSHGLWIGRDLSGAGLGAHDGSAARMRSRRAGGSGPRASHPQKTPGRSTRRPAAPPAAASP